MDRNHAGEHSTEWGDELQGCAGCMPLCSEGLSRERSHAEEEDVPFTGEMNWPAGLVHLLDDCNKELAS